MLSYYCMVLLGLYSSVLCAMEDKKCQLDFCPTRSEYYRQKAANNQNPNKICFFCDKESLKSNYIISEDVPGDVRVMMNKTPYPDFDQAIHLLIMPMSHKELPSDFSHKELTEQSGALQWLSTQLHATAYTQEYFTNWGKMAGQTVPHWHSHVKSYTMPPFSMPQRMKYFKNPVIKNIEEAFENTKKLLESPMVEQQLLEAQHNENKCLCCLLQKGQMGSDEENFVVARFTHNYVCLAHYSFCAGEIAIIPNRHVASIKDLLQGELTENMALAMALLPKMSSYAHEKIRDCDGGNVYTKSMGAKASVEQQMNYHVHTLIMPRTTITPIPGAMDGNSCKLDYNPDHLFAYLKEKIDEIKDMLT